MHELHELLHPRGWLQSTELDLGRIKSMSGEVNKQPGVKAWIICYEKCMKRLERKSDVGASIGKMMLDAGFRDVRLDYIRLPIGSWDESKCPNISLLDTPSLGYSAPQRCSVVDVLYSQTDM